MINDGRGIPMAKFMVSHTHTHRIPRPQAWAWDPTYMGVGIYGTHGMKNPCGSALWVQLEIVEISSK